MSFIMNPSHQRHCSSIHQPDIISKDFKNKVYIMIAVPHHILWLFHFCGQSKWRSRGEGGWGLRPEGVYVKENKSVTKNSKLYVTDFFCVKHRQCKIFCDSVNIS